MPCPWMRRSRWQLKPRTEVSSLKSFEAATRRIEENQEEDDWPYASLAFGVELINSFLERSRV